MKRDDLLQLAYEAESALGIARSSARRKFQDLDEEQVFQRALDIHLTNANNPGIGGYTRGQFLAFAGKIVEFCARTGSEVGRDQDAAALFSQALESVSPADGSRRARLRREPTRAVLIRQLAARSLRLAGRFDEAGTLVSQPEGYFFATGVEHVRARYEYELVANLLVTGQARQVWHALVEADQYWQGERAVSFLDRHRYRYALAIADWQLGSLSKAEQTLRKSISELQSSRDDQVDDWPEVCLLSVTLALAELLHQLPNREDDAVIWLGNASKSAQALRARWRVVARSRSPLSVAIRRVWGDMALLAAALPGWDAARLGATVAFSAKQSGFASLMRAERALLADSKIVLGIIDAIQEREASVIDAALGIDTLNEVRDQLDGFRRELQKNVTPILADFVLPETVDLASVTDNLQGRWALDFVGLPDSIDAGPEEPNWFRTLITPDGTVEFEQFSPGSATTNFLGRTREWVHPTIEASSLSRPDWVGLATELLPRSLLTQLRAVRSRRPIELVISGHHRLSHVPWVALKVNRQTRLLEKAIVTQSPVLTCISSCPLPPVSGLALIRLVGEPVRIPSGDRLSALSIEAECRAWGIPFPGARHSPPLSQVNVAAGGPAEPAAGTFVSQLTFKGGHPYKFAHAAAHGIRDGLAQQVWLPEPLSAGGALNIKWPPSVLMACCRLGRVANRPDEEPFGFVICMLSAGAHCAVVGVDEIDDVGTGAIAALIVDRLRAGSARLDKALRDAQRVHQHEPLDRWALLATYVS